MSAAANAVALLFVFTETMIDVVLCYLRCADLPSTGHKAEACEAKDHHGPGGRLRNGRDVVRSKLDVEKTKSQKIAERYGCDRGRGGETYKIMRVQFWVSDSVTISGTQRNVKLGCYWVIFCAEIESDCGRGTCVHR